MASITQSGTQGSQGTTNNGTGESGTNGGPGGDISLTEATGLNGNTDSTNSVSDQGGEGGGGGQGGTGGSGGAGGAGGNATAIATTTVVDGSSSSASATGGTGGNGGAAGGTGGAAGNATSVASINSSAANAGSILAAATAEGGTAGEAGFGTVADGGGTASATASAVATGKGTNATAEVLQVGGLGGLGEGSFVALDPGGSGGAGQSSSLINAVSGSTNGADLSLTQTAEGGSGGGAQQGTAGAAGNASSTLNVTDSTSISVSGTGSASGGFGGSSGIGNGADGGSGTSEVDITGTAIVDARANAAGGFGGAGGGLGVDGPQGDPSAGGNFAGDGGNGGNATATATGESVTTGLAALAPVDVTAVAQGGTGNSGADGNETSGNGGIASATAYGSSNTTAEVSVVATAIGGNGGSGNNFENGTFGEGPALGGNGATIILNNAVGGATDGGLLIFDETAQGGNGGDSAGGIAGTAGEGSATLNFNDTTVNPSSGSALVDATVNGEGGNGGSALGAGTAGVVGGAGIADSVITGGKAVDSVAQAFGGDGGTGNGDPDGAGGSATATAVGIAGTADLSEAASVGGEGQGGAAAGTALATASAEGASGTALSVAETTAANGAAVTAVIARASATVTGAGTNGAVSTTAGAGIGGAAPAGVSGQQAVAVFDTLPSSAAVSSVLATNGALAFELNSGSTFAVGQLAASANGSAVTQTESASVAMTIDSADIATSGQVLIGLYGGAPSGSFTSMTFAVDAGSSVLINQTFTTVAQADAFFDDNVLDLGSSTTGPTSGTPVITISLSLTEDTAGAGYSIGVAGGEVSGTGTGVAPIIIGAVAGQATTGDTPLDPFSTVTVEDPNMGATDALTITFNGSDGTLSGGDLGGSNGSYTLSGTTAAAITSELDALSFTPSGPGTTTFTLSDKSSGFATPGTNDVTTVIDTNVAAPPTITGTVPGQTTTSEAAVMPFSGVMVKDPNAGASDTITITYTGAGTLSGSGLGGSAGNYTLSAASPATITSELEGLTFQPVDDVPNTSVTTTFTLSDTSTGFGTATTDSTTSVIDTDPAVAPTITGTAGNQSTTSEASDNPFSAVTITDPNNGGTNIDTLSITLAGGGSLSGTGLNGTNGTYSLKGTAQTITTDLDGLTFAPVNGVPNTSVTTTFTLSLSSVFADPTVDTKTSVIDNDPAVTPTISGTEGGQTTTSDTPISPFTTAVAGDPNNGGTDSDTLTITYTGGGTLSGSGLGGTSGDYTLTGTANTITTALEGLSFAPGGAGMTTFTLSDKSTAFATPAVDKTTTVADSNPASAPTISDTVPNQNTTSEATVTPFSGAVVGDPNSGASDTLTITYTAGDGALSGGGLTGSAGDYTLLAASAGTITSELEGLTFTPVNGVPDTSVTTIFTLSDLSSGFGTPTVNKVASVIDTDPAVPPTITGTAPGQTTTFETPIAPFSTVVVADTNNDGTNTDTLTITYTGGGTLSGTGLIGSSGDYSLTATAATITTDLQGLMFTPSGPGMTTFDLSDLSPVFLTPASNDATTVTDSDITNAAPTITGTKAGQTTVDFVPIKPFSTVVVADADTGVSDSLTIVLENGLGVVTDANGTLTGTGLHKTGIGTYTLAAASPATLSSELDALTFVPTEAEVAAGNTVTTSFTLTASQTVGSSTVTTTNSATSVVVTALHYANGPAGGAATIFGTSGQDVITAHGFFNAIYGEGGADFINAGSGLAYVNVANGSATVTLGGALNLVTGTSGNVTISGAPGGLTTVSLGNGNNVITVGGEHDVILLGNGNNVISGGQGMEFIATGAGNDTITLGGSGNTVNAGGGTNVIHGGSGGDMFILPAASLGFDTITGFSETNGDVLNVVAALSATDWNGRSATLGNFLKVIDNNGSTTLSIAPTGAGAGIAIANLSGAGNFGLADLQSHHSLLV